MALCNTKQSYGKVTKTLHWLVMILVIGLLIVGTLMGDISDKGVKGQVYMVHKLTGVLVFMLGTIFLMWSAINPKPGYSKQMPTSERCLAKLTHLSLYGLLIAMPLSGWVMSSAAGYYPNFFGLFDIPLPLIPHSKPIAEVTKALHYYFAWAFFAFITLHVVGALKHQLIDKNNILKRMLH